MSIRRPAGTSMSAAQRQALHAVLGAREHVQAAESRAETWRTVLNQRVAKALAAGVRADELAENLGVSAQRIYQMRDEAPKS